MINDELRRRLQIVSEANYDSGISNIRMGIRKPQYAMNRASMNIREDQYQPYMDNYY